MQQYYLLVVVLIPILGGILIPLIPFKNRNHMAIYTEALVLLNSILVWLLLFYTPEESFIMIRFTGSLSVAFHMDGLSKVFAGLVSFLWPLATLYAFEYMKHEKNEKIFFMFYIATYGVTLGISLSENILTMYLFYEMLTLITVPLVIHTLSKEAILAARKYMYYSFGGAAFAFVGVVFLLVYGNATNFVYGGVLNIRSISNRHDVLLWVYVLCFFGFGVKAAVCPFNSWLPQAGVAPTPVTALLHAVAVVKSGAFAIIRITYYSFGTRLLRGTWAQNVVMAAAIVTIIYGCSRAIKERHLKRRLAYSTISNLSYILFGVTIMTPLGLVGALCHLVFHAFMKICSFFCAGAVIYKTEKNYVYELDGLGRKMPKIFGIFTIAAFALMGVPGLCGFISKFNLAKAAVESENTLAYVGIGALLISAFLTAIYMFSIIMRVFYPPADFDYNSIKDAEDPNWMMLLPLFVFVIVIVGLGLFSEPLVHMFEQIAMV